MVWVEVFFGYLVDYRGSISNSGHSRGSKYMGSRDYSRNNWSCCIDIVSVGKVLSLCFVPGWFLGFRRAVNTSGW